MEQHTDDFKGVKVKKVVELSIMRLKKNACRRLIYGKLMQAFLSLVICSAAGRRMLPSARDGAD